MGPGGYNYTPSEMLHEGWVGPDGNLLLITVDGPWDLNLVGGVNAEMPPIN
jgi:hypothetical protein